MCSVLSSLGDRLLFWGILTYWAAIMDRGLMERPSEGSFTELLMSYSNMINVKPRLYLEACNNGHIGFFCMGVSGLPLSFCCIFTAHFTSKHFIEGHIWEFILQLNQQTQYSYHSCKTMKIIFKSPICTENTVWFNGLFFTYFMQILVHNQLLLCIFSSFLFSH